MANASSARSDRPPPPHASEMRERYDRVLGGRDVALVDGPVFLLGLYCACPRGYSTTRRPSPPWRHTTSSWASP